MADDGEDANTLKHELRNIEQQKRALQHLLQRATDEIDDLIDSDCDPAVKAKAAKVSDRFRRAAEI